jgi:hypothetical protein
MASAKMHLALVFCIGLTAAAPAPSTASALQPAPAADSALTPRVAAAAAFCAYRNSVYFLGGYLDKSFYGADGSACLEPKKAGWVLSEEYRAADTTTGDTDNADLYRSGGDCLLAFHGHDGEDVDMSTWVENPQGSKISVRKWAIDELEVITGLIEDKHGSLGEWAATCSGSLYISGHSMGALMGSLLGYYANLDSDPLKLGKRVAKMHLFGMPFDYEGEVINEQSEDGCFPGAIYYSVVPEGYVPGYGAFADKVGIEVAAQYVKDGRGNKTPKMTKIAVEVKGNTSFQSNMLGFGTFDECGTGLPDVYTKMMNNATLYTKAAENYFRVTDTGGFGVHNGEPYVWNLPKKDKPDKYEKKERKACKKRNKKNHRGKTEDCEELSPRMAAEAFACTYRNSLLAPYFGGESYHNTTFCKPLEDAGWKIKETYKVYDPSTFDTDNADLFQNGDDCLLSLHGADEGTEMASVVNETTTLFGVSGLSLSHAKELEAILNKILETHDSLAAWAASCPGALHVTGHSVGGGVAAMFAYLANKKGDPMGIEKVVSKVFTYGSNPAANFSLSNDQSTDGCFEGSNYYTRAPAGTLPGYGDFADAAIVNSHALLSPSVASAGGMPLPTAKVHPKLSWTSLDVTGPTLKSGEVDVGLTVDMTGFSGPGLVTPCGSDPPVLAQLATNVTVFSAAAGNAYGLPYPGVTKESLALHWPTSYVFSFPAGRLRPTPASATPPSPPPPSTPPCQPAAQCACDTVMVVCEADCDQHQDEREGRYVRMEGVEQNHRGVYKQENGPNYLYFGYFGVDGFWIVDPDVTNSGGWLHTGDQACCPDETGSWMYWSGKSVQDPGSAWVAGGVKVMCPPQGGH